jgi:hypothetical protein
MIIVDENLQSRKLIAAISSWYKGPVLSVLAVRPATLIHDDGITTLLRQTNAPTFVTINVVDFWLKLQAHPGFCIVAITLPQSQSAQVPFVLRSIFSQREFRTKAARMGKVIHVMPTYLEFYGIDRTVYTISRSSH